MTEQGVAFVSTMPPPPESAAGQRVGRYVLLKHLGAGGMGTVELAYDPELDRRVAIKLMRVPAGADAEDSAGATRLQREAQAMAKVSHPNVVTVFDVGTHEGQVFVAMEYVRGETLRSWQSKETRAVRDVVATYVQAGRGIAAAHARGVLHRDFKPDNVLVDEQGRARVLDFGLARAVVPSSASVGRIALEDTQAIGASLLGAEVTQAGAIIGTPAYMAPEQLRGGEVDGRADQFAFAVSLFEALYGVRPFEGTSLVTLAAAIEAGKIREPPPRAGVPRRLRAAIDRALRPRAADRFASMDELVAEIERAIVAPRRRAMVALAALAAVVALGLGARALRRPPAAPPICVGFEQELAGTWDAQRRREVTQAFHDADATNADAAIERAIPALDAYAARWTAASREACEATRVRRSQSEEALDLRMACLAQRRKELAATTALLAHADASTVNRAALIAVGLTPVATCSDLAALRAPFTLPRDPAQRAEVDRIRGDVAQARALWSAGRYADGKRVAEGAVAAARTVAYRPVEAEALLWQAKNASMADGVSPDEVAATFFGAAVTASEVRHDDAEAAAWSGLVSAAGYRQSRYEDAERYAALARAALVRAGGDDDVAEELEHNLGNVDYLRGHRDDALEHYRRALAIRERASGPDDPRAVSARYDVATTLEPYRPFAASEAEYRTIVAATERAFGPSHPKVALRLYSLAHLLLLEGKYSDALPLLVRALTLSRGASVLGPMEADYAEALFHLGRDREARGATKEAIALVEERFGADSGYAAMTRIDFARIALLHDRDVRAARAACDRDLSIAEKRADETDPNLGGALAICALVSVRDGDRAGGEAAARRALAVFEGHGFTRHPLLAVARLALAEALVGAGKKADAAQAIAPAAALCASDIGDPWVCDPVRALAAR